MSEIILDSTNPKEYKYAYEALIDSIGKDFGGWQSACWPTRNGNGNFRIWFPQLADIMHGQLVAASNNCLNTLSEDWNTLTYDDLRCTNEEFKYKGIINLIFAREPKKGPYIFRGVYVLDVDASAPNHYIYRRIGKKVRMIGLPAEDIEIIEDEVKPVKNVPIQSDLEKPIISFACGGTYKLISETRVHAHPVTIYYPSMVYPYLMTRAHGGITDYLYKVVDCIELNPMDRDQVNSLSDKYISVRSYINQRIPRFGFKKAPIPYRFYVLEPVHRFDPVFKISDNHERPINYTFEDVGLEEQDVNGFRKQVAEENIEIEKQADDHMLEGADRLAFVKTRVNQGVFREGLLKKYKCCCLCGMNETDLLLASHIKPWIESNPKEKTDVNNGLLLCPNHDKLFDKGYISFDDSGNIIISETLSNNNQIYMNVNQEMSIVMSEKTRVYMKYHREKHFS